MSVLAARARARTTPPGIIVMSLMFGCAHEPVAAPIPSDWAHTGGSAEGYGRWDTWCTGAPDCAYAEPAPGLKRRVIRDEPKGRTYEAIDIPADGGWGIVYAERPDGSFELSFLRYVGANLTDKLALGNPSILTIEQTEITVPAPALPTTEPKVRAWATAQLDALEARARAELAGGRVRRCSYNRYLGDGSPVCDPVPLPTAEVDAWTRQVHDQLERARTHIRDDGTTLYALLTAVRP